MIYFSTGYRDHQLKIQVGENYSYLSNLKSNISKLSCLSILVNPNNSDLTSQQNRSKATVVTLSGMKGLITLSPQCQRVPSDALKMGPLGLRGQYAQNKIVFIYLYDFQHFNP